MNDTGWNAVGKSVPASRLTACANEVVKILPDVDPCTLHSICECIADAVRRSELHRVTADVCDLDPILNKIDVTGRYRLLAVILTEADCPVCGGKGYLSPVFSHEEEQDCPNCN